MFSRPSLQEIVDRIIGDFNTRISGATSFLRRSVLRDMGRVYAGAVHLIYGYLAWQKDQLFITTADEENLEIHGSEYGIPRTAATYAKGTGLATGTAGTVIPINSELQSGSGQVYLTDIAYTIGVGGTVEIDFTAKESGANGNDDAGISLTFVSPIIGVDTVVVVGTDGIEGGADLEDIEDYRLRVLTRKRQPPHGGADFDYRAWMLEVPGNTRAWAIPLYQGVGTIGCVFVRDDDGDLIPSDSEIETTKNYIIEHTDPLTGKQVGIPVTAESGLFMIKPEKLTVDFTIQLYPNTTEVQESIRTNLEDLILAKGGAEQSIYKSQIDEVISLAVNEDFHKLIYPSSDFTSAHAGQVHVMGGIIFEDLVI